jgi:hypothetical protein
VHVRSAKNDVDLAVRRLGVVELMLSVVREAETEEARCGRSACGA